MLTQARINLLLGALVLILGAVVLFEPVQDTGESQLPLSELSSERINRITRSGPGEQTFTLQHESAPAGSPSGFPAADRTIRGRNS